MTPMSFFWYNLFPLTCVAVAASMVMYDKPGWGWFLFVAACMAVFPTTNKSDNGSTESR